MFRTVNLNVPAIKLFKPGFILQERNVFEIKANVQYAEGRQYRGLFQAGWLRNVFLINKCYMVMICDMA